MLFLITVPNALILLFLVLMLITFIIGIPIAFISSYKESNEEQRRNWQTLYFTITGVMLIIAFFIFLFIDVPRYYIYVDVALFCALLYACHKWLNKIRLSTKKQP